MSRLHLRSMLLAALLAFTVLDAAPPPPLRVIAVGDVHGAADAFAGILQRAGLIDGERRWIGGTAVLVQTGDLLARGQRSGRFWISLSRLNLKQPQPVAGCRSSLAITK